MKSFLIEHGKCVLFLYTHKKKESHKCHTSQLVLRGVIFFPIPQLQEGSREPGQTLILVLHQPPA